MLSEDPSKKTSNGENINNDQEANRNDSAYQKQRDQDEQEDGESPARDEDNEASPVPEDITPPLPKEAPPLPAEALPVEDDGWEPKWDDRAQSYYFFNRLTNVSQWENPRVPEVAQPPPPGVASDDIMGTTQELLRPVAGGYDPAIHGDYDPDADYAKVQVEEDPTLPQHAPGTEPAVAYAATGAFNRFTGKWQRAELAPENFNDENKSKRQMNAFFDVDAAANSHDGKSLKAERAGKKLSKQELMAFKEKRRERKEEKRRAWLRD